MNKGFKIVSLIIAYAVLITQSVLIIMALYKSGFDHTEQAAMYGRSPQEYLVMPLLFVGGGLGILCFIFMIINIVSDIVRIDPESEFYEKSDLMYILLFTAAVMPFAIAYIFKTVLY